MNYKQEFSYLAMNTVGQVLNRRGIDIKSDAPDYRWIMVAEECFKLGYKMALNRVHLNLGPTTHVAVSDEIRSVLESERERIQQFLDRVR